MTPAELDEAIRAAPFKSFEIVTADGQRFPVPTPDHISVSPSKESVIVWWDSGGHSSIDVYLMTHLNYVPRRKLSRKPAWRR